MVWWWFGANMAGQRNKNAFKFLLILLILSQKHIFGVKKVVWDGLDVVWGGLEVVWGVSTDPVLFSKTSNDLWKRILAGFYVFGTRNLGVIKEFLLFIKMMLFLPRHTLF